MAYTALARKYRPKTFAELVGQEHVVRALTNALETGRVHHAFLFTGTRGVGKTTIARIFAKCLNCIRAEQSPHGMTAEPCGTCAACVEIDSGRFVDLIEVDAASRTKVDDTRELLDNVQYAPTRARYKVYLIDEVHMLSTHSFNALLKTLEEPPPHVKFLLATTDPQKLPVTVLSRCLQFNLKRLPVGQIGEHMRKILEAEKVAFDAGGIRLVAVAADGSMRDGLSLLDQLIAFGGGKVDEESARAMLGTIARDHVVQLAEHLAGGDAAALVRYAQSLEQWAPDYAQVLDELASLLVRVGMKQAVPDFEGDEIYAPELLEKLAKSLSPEDVQLYYQTAVVGRRDLALVSEPRVGFEMTLLRMLAFRPAEGGATAGAPQAPRSAQATGTAPRVAGAVGTGSVSAAHGAPAASAVASAPQTPAGPPLEATPAAWSAILNQLELTGSARQLANHCALLGRKDAVVRFGFDSKSGFVRTQGQVEKLAQALTKYFGETVRVEFESLPAGLETPAQMGQRASLEELDSARQALESDPGVQLLREKFGATLLPDSVRPVK
ncbi:MAG TPA: DNA polymerase III subunit gamma/tau [Steroidobacteraceae bacterium]|jgi:DNA polymerase-3 subunit gamma/tau|nr:DNA polymerase III subunit gamma/tau [Steroidobacteraceae bacterium]